MAQPIDPQQTSSAGQFVGINKCAACHFQYYENWKTSPHGKAFEILPAKYQNDSECLKCHVTGSSQAGTASASAHATGVSCEACHGPGGDHANLALSYVGQETLLTEETLKLLRSKIKKTALDQCIKCHTSMAHKPHPEFDRDDLPRQSQTSPRVKRRLAEVHN